MSSYIQDTTGLSRRRTLDIATGGKLASFDHILCFDSPLTQNRIAE
jgi:hypothetical protein